MKHAIRHIHFVGLGGSGMSGLNADFGGFRAHAGKLSVERRGRL